MLALWLTVALAAAPEEFVLLRPGAALLPPEGIDAGTSTTVSACCLDNPLERSNVVRFVSEQGDWLQIETLGYEPDRDDHCGVEGHDDQNFQHRLKSYRLQLRVRRSDVVTVTRQAVKLGYPDGTRALVNAGAPAEVAASEGLVRFAGEVTLELPATALGLHYSPSQPLGSDKLVRWFSVTTDTDARIGPKGFIHFGEATPVAATYTKDAVLLEQRTRCARLVALAPKSAVKKHAPGHSGALLRVAMCVELGDWNVPVESTVYWPDGRVAGTTTDAEAISRVRTVGKRKCSDVQLQGSSSVLPLCFDTDGLTPTQSAP
jgi:hypothetical protein